jgi:four helix bundle protein
MNAEQMKQRTKAMALRIIKLCSSLPRDMPCYVMGRQLLRCSTSVTANYRAACRAKSPADFIAKLGIVEEEADECCLWIELLTESGAVSADRVKDLKQECQEILAMIVASINTARGGKRKASKRSVPKADEEKSAIRIPQSAIEQQRHG